MEFFLFSFNVIKESLKERKQELKIIEKIEELDNVNLGFTKDICNSITSNSSMNPNSTLDPNTKEYHCSEYCTKPPIGPSVKNNKQYEDECLAACKSICCTPDKVYLCI